MSSWSLYTLMLRSKLYQNPSFSTVHQCVNKPRTWAVKTFCGPTFSFNFLCNHYQFFYIACQDANMPGSNGAIIGCNLPKELQLALQTQNRVESTYILPRANYITIWEEIFKTYKELASCEVLYSFISVCLKTPSETSASLKNSMKTHLIYCMLLMVFLLCIGVSIFHYELQRVKCQN